MLDRPAPPQIDSRFGLWLFGSGLYSGKTKGRGGGAIITAGFECVQMTDGRRLHTAGLAEGDDHSESDIFLECPGFGEKPS